MEGCGRGGASPGAADVKEEPAWVTYEVFIEEEVRHTDEDRVKEAKLKEAHELVHSEGRAASWADVYATGVTEIPVLGTARNVQRPNIVHTLYAATRETEDMTHHRLPATREPAPQGPTPQQPTPQGSTPQEPTAQGSTPQEPTPQEPAPYEPTPQEPTPRDTNTDALTPTVQSIPSLRLWCPFNTRVVPATRETADTSHRRLPAAASGAPRAGHEPAPQEANTNTATTPTVQIKDNHSTTDKQITTTKRPYTCDICNKGFTQSGSLSVHKRIHTGEKPYSCEVCSMKFTALGTYNKHKVVHTQVRPYSCKICKKGFTQVSGLMFHERIHAGVKPYCCDICKKPFRHKSALTVHNRIHTGIKPYTCEICQKQFAHNSALWVHNKTHTGVKPYTCDICNKQFSQKGNLKYHIGTHAARRLKARAKNKSVYK